MNNITQLDNLISRLLDRGYQRTTRDVLARIAATTNTGRVQQRLSELNQEAARLAETGQRLTPDNPVLTALLTDLNPALRRSATLIDAAAPALQTNGATAAGQLTRQLALPGLDDQAIAAFGISWNTPDPEAVNELINLVNTAEWADELGGYPNRILSTVNNQAVRGVLEGWNPLRTAREITRITQSLPSAQANTLMRTLQLTSYRRGAAVHQQANIDILDGQIRVATLDARTCLACLALHGERLPAGQPIQDHHNGRCTAVPLVKGRPRQIQTGPQWFNSLSTTEQEQLGWSQQTPGKLDAIRAGRADFRDFIQRYEDRTFGDMLREGSLQAALAK